MIDLTLEQTNELEKALKIKKEALDIYNNFNKYVTLNVSDFKDGKFRIWSDSHNSTYIALDGKGFTFQARFLHETYDVEVNPSSIFELIKRDYRGICHLVSVIDTAKKNAEKLKKD